MADVDEDDFLYGDSAETTAPSTTQKPVDQEMNQASEGEVDESEESDSVPNLTNVPDSGH
jgi:hypothetical protein